MTDQEPMSFDADEAADPCWTLDGPVHLPSLTACERERAMAQLREWVTVFVARFAVEPRVIPPCWEKHNGMVEALLALRDYERVSYAETAPPTAPVEWFSAYREIEARLIALAAQTQCTPHEHRSGHLQRWRPSESDDGYAGR